MTLSTYTSFFIFLVTKYKILLLIIFDKKYKVYIIYFIYTLVHLAIYYIFLLIKKAISLYTNISKYSINPSKL